MTTLYVLLVLAAPADDPLERARHLAAALPNHGPLLVEVALAEGGDAARKQLLEFFEAMGPTDPLTLSARRRLSSLIFS